MQKTVSLKQIAPSLMKVCSLEGTKQLLIQSHWMNQSIASMKMIKVWKKLDF